MANIGQLGFIGAGAMATSIIRGVLRVHPKLKVMAYDVYRPSVDKLIGSLQTETLSAAASGRQVVEQCDVVVLAVKPDNVTEVLMDVKEALQKHNPLVITICAVCYFIMQKIKDQVTNFSHSKRPFPYNNVLTKIISISMLCFY